MVGYAIATAVVEINRSILDVSRLGLVSATLHNLFELGIIGYATCSEPAASTNWLRSQLWILLVTQWVLFAPTLVLAGLGAQLTGIICDWMLLIVWARLYLGSDQPRRAYLKWGLAGAVLHLFEILPLVALLTGVAKAPSIFGGSAQPPPHRCHYDLLALPAAWTVLVSGIRIFDLMCGAKGGRGFAGPSAAELPSQAAAT